jgi:hypothetical protein
VGCEARHRALVYLLHKHSTDLEDTKGIADGRKTKRMDRKEVDLLMGGGERRCLHLERKESPEGGLSLFSDSLIFSSSPSLHTQRLYRSFVSILDLLILPQVKDRLVGYVLLPIRKF